MNSYSEQGEIITCFLLKCLPPVRGSRTCSAGEGDCQMSPVGTVGWTRGNSAYESRM